MSFTPFSSFLARDALIERIVALYTAMMLIRLSVWDGRALLSYGAL